MMHISALKCSYGRTVNAKYVVMPYKGEGAEEEDEGDFCALVVLPNEENKIGLLEAAKDLFAIPNVVHFAVHEASDSLVMLSMPVFEIDSPARSLKLELQNTSTTAILSVSKRLDPPRFSKHFNFSAVAVYYQRQTRFFCQNA